MKQYLLFIGPNYYLGRGLEDLHSTHDTHEAAVAEAARQKDKWDPQSVAEHWAEVWDTNLLKDQEPVNLWSE